MKPTYEELLGHLIAAINYLEFYRPPYNLEPLKKAVLDACETDQVRKLINEEEK